MADLTPNLHSLSGSIERITFHNPENGYCVLRVKAKGQRELVTLVGNCASLAEGEHVEATGDWSQHREFGLQFAAKELRTVRPTTLEGIEKYLGSGMVKGIGPHFAGRLVRAFGHEVFEVIENRPQALRKVEGIGPVRIRKITSAWAEQKIVRDIMVFLQSHGVSTAKAVRIYKTYGTAAIDRVRENPYCLARDISGIGFKSADAIALTLGVARDSIVRAGAGLAHALAEKTSEGHCAFPEDELLPHAATLLEMPQAILQQALGLELLEGRLIREAIGGRNCIFPADLYRAENSVAAMLRDVVRGNVPWKDLEIEKALAWVDSELGMPLAPLQREAVATALRSKCLIVTGGPGTGKTTLTRAIVSILKAKNVRIGLCSPTGRAAKRLAECTGMEAKTIHRLLGYDAQKGGFLHDRQHRLEVDLLLLDEASMVDLSLLNNLLKALPPEAALILVGDVDQIPSVGPGAVLQSLIDSGVLPTVRLTQIFRQAAASHIVESAHRINHGELPALDYKEGDFYFFPAETPQRILQTINELVKEKIPRRFGFDSVRDIQLLCPMNRSGLGAKAINAELQKTLNPGAAPKVERFGTSYAPDDKVMVTANDYDKEVFNGDIGFVKSVDPEEQELIAEFDGRAVSFGFNELDILALAYAVTIHKSQGSEYPAVVIPLATQHFMMLRRNLLYTGVTRGKKLVILVGQRKAIEMAIGSLHQGTRWNNLAARLRAAPEESSPAAAP